MAGGWHGLWLLGAMAAHGFGPCLKAQGKSQGEKGMVEAPGAPGPRRVSPAGSRSSHYFARGFDLDQGTDFALVVEGIPINLPFTVRGGGFLDRGLLIPETQAGLKYRRGPYRDDQGPSAVAGSAEIALLRSHGGPEAQVSFGGASTDRHARLLWLDGTSRSVYAVEAVRGYRDWEDLDGASKVNGYLRVAQTASGAGWTGILLANHERADGGSFNPRRPLPPWFQDEEWDLRVADGTNIYRLVGALQHRSEPGGQVTDFFQVYGGASRFLHWTDNTYYLYDDYWGDQLAQRDRRVYGGVEGRRQWVIPAGAAEWIHRLGFQARWDEVREATLDLGYVREAKTPLLDAQARSLQGSLHGQSLVRQGRWTAFLGGRLDAQDNRVFGPNPASPGHNPGTKKDSLFVPDPAKPRHTRNTLFSPKAGLARALWKDAEARLSWGWGFRQGNAFRGEQALTRVRSADLVLQARPLPFWESSAALWRLDLEHEALFSPPENGALQDQPSRRRGLDWYNEVRRGPWSAELCVSWSHARFRGDGGRVPGSPSRTGFLGLGWKRRGYGASARFRSLAGYPLTRDGEAFASAQKELELALQRDWKSWSVGVQVFNAFDLRTVSQEWVYTSRLPKEPQEGVPTRHWKSPDPQAIRVEVRRRF